MMTRTEINFDVFMKIVNQRSCLTQEMRRVFLGIHKSMKEMKSSGKLNVKVDSDDDENQEADQSNAKKAKPRSNIVPVDVADRPISIFQATSDPEKLAK